MNRNSIFSVVAQLVVVCTLFLWLVVGAPPQRFPEEVETHFYQLSVTHLNPGINSPWVDNLQGENFLALSADSGEGATGPGGVPSENPMHEVYLGRIGGGTPKAVGRVDFGLGSGEAHRTLDFKASEVNGGFEIFVSYATLSKNSKCRHLIVRRFNLLANQSANDDPIEGEALFRSPCIPFAPDGDSRLQESGGRLEIYRAEEWSSLERPRLLLTVGDFGNLRTLYSNLDPEVSRQLGSILEISAGSARVVASGFRNPQGLAMVELHGVGMSILQTEHGPRGGDELNIIREGGDYGWPGTSSGTAYGPERPESAANLQGFHIGAEPPLYSWLPSIAPSQIVQISGVEFSQWWTQPESEGQTGDIIVGSLKAESLFRIRILNGSILYVEQIHFGKRIRNVTELESGRLLIGTDDGELLLISAKSAWNTEIDGFE